MGSLTEILRLHGESSGAYRSEKSLLWLFQQRGGYKLSDDPGLQFRMEEPQILEALSTKMVYQLSLDEKMKILLCLMNQIVSYATVRDEIDEKFNDMLEAKADLRQHTIDENKRQRQVDEAERLERKKEREEKKEAWLKAQENQAQANKQPDSNAENGEKPAENAETSEKPSEKPAAKPKVDEIPAEVLLT